MIAVRVTGGGECATEGCTHTASYQVRGELDYHVCACCLPVEVFGNMTSEEQVEAIRLSALENDSYEVDGEGKIRLKED
jgi:hypothetical protein